MAATNDSSLHRGSTIVELLVTVAVIAVLVALVLPAVGVVRESARRAQCQNNLKQIALGLLAYHDVHTEFPCGGWGHHWVGVPERGAGRRQPGGWIYSLLPYLEESGLHGLGAGLGGSAADALYSQRLQTPICLLTCPSRRSCAAWPVADPYAYVRTPKPFGNVSLVARADYAINAGTSHVFSFSGPADLQQGDDPQFWRDAPHPKKFSGISHLRIAAPLRAVIDGTSKTYLVGEKHLDADRYTTGTSVGDNESLYAGYCTDLHRFAGVIENRMLSLPPYAAPLNDHAPADNNIPTSVRFGSAHPTGFHMGHCDGSIRFLAYAIDPEVHFRAGHRRDEGQPLASLP